MTHNEKRIHCIELLYKKQPRVYHDFAIINKFILTDHPEMVGGILRELVEEGTLRINRSELAPLWYLSDSTRLVLVEIELKELNNRIETGVSLLQPAVTVTPDKKPYRKPFKGHA